MVKLGASIGMVTVGFSLLTGCQHFVPAPVSAGKSAEALEARSLDAEALRSFLSRNLTQALPNWPVSRWDFDMLLLAAFYYHPNLKVARAEWAVMQAGEVTAGARPNPTVGVTPEYNFNPASGVSPWLPAISFDLPLETAGKRGYRQAKARHLSDAARLKIATAAWQVRSNLRAALLTCTAAKQRATLLQDAVQIQQKVVQSLEQRFAAGAISSFELTTARLSLARLQADWDALKRQEAEALARVAGAIGVPVAALAEISLEYSPELPAETDLTSTPLRRQALTSRADILSLLAEYAASQSTLQLEIARQYPDIHLGTGYQWDQEENKWALGLTAELPLLNRNQGPIAEAKANRAATAARFEALQFAVLNEIDRATASYGSALAHLKNLDDLVATQQKQRESVEAQLKAGIADNLELLNAQAEVMQSESLRFEGRFKALQALGELEQAIQRPFPALSIIERTPVVSSRKESQ